MVTQHDEVGRTKLSFMHWPVEWLWIAVIVSVAMLVFVGLFLGTGHSPPADSSVPSSTPLEPARGS
jgi:hypothetical protein